MGFFKGSKYTYLVAGSANIVGLITGTAVAWSSPVLAILQGDDLSKTPLNRQITNNEASWIGALATLSGIFGPFLYGFLVDRIGRKPTVAALAVPYFIGFLIAAFAQTVELFYVARILMGVGVASTFSIIPPYIVETAQDVNRGFFQGSLATYMNLGSLLSYCIGPYTSLMTFNLILSAICVIFVPVFWYVAPETSYYLISKNREKEAFATLSYLRRRPDDEIFTELRAMESHLKQHQPGPFSDIFKNKATIKAFVYSIAMTTFQQFSGILCVSYFTQNIFDASGSDLPPEVSSIILGVAQLCVSIISPPFFDRTGRKRLLFITVSGAMIAEILLGIYFYPLDSGNDVSAITWLPVFSLVMFTSFYNFGMGAIPWAVVPEIIPLNVLAKAVSVIASFNWLTGFLLTYYFEALSEAIGMGGSFWLFAGFLALYDLFIFIFMFETKGKSLAEIQEILNK